MPIKYTQVERKHRRDTDSRHLDSVAAIAAYGTVPPSPALCITYAAAVLSDSIGAVEAINTAPILSDSTGATQSDSIIGR